MGQRIAKHQYNEAGTTWEKSTYYVRDAQGNVLGTYDKTVPGSNSLKVIERSLYGSSRIGMNVTQAEMILAAAPSTTDFKHEIAVKQFEISNHLGNVLAVITDRKTPIDDGDHDGNNDGTNETHTTAGALDNIIDFYKAQVISSSDYSPFGVQLDGRNFSSTAYRYGFQGQEKDDEMKGAGNSVNFTYRMHDPRLGRFFAVDPLSWKYPHNSTYAFSENRVIDGVELEGLEWQPVDKNGNNVQIGSKDIVDYKWVGYIKNTEGTYSKPEGTLSWAEFNKAGKKITLVADIKTVGGLLPGSKEDIPTAKFSDGTTQTVSIQFFSNNYTQIIAVSKDKIAYTANWDVTGLTTTQIGAIIQIVHVELEITSLKEELHEVGLKLHRALLTEENAGSDDAKVGDGSYSRTTRKGGQRATGVLMEEISKIGADMITNYYAEKYAKEYNEIVTKIQDKQDKIDKIKKDNNLKEKE